MSFQKAKTETSQPEDLTSQDIEDIKAKLNLGNISDSAFNNLLINVNQDLSNFEIERQLFQDKADQIKSLILNSGTNQKIYLSLNNAINKSPKPDDNTLFSVMDENNPNDNGYYIFKSSEQNGVKFLRKFNLPFSVESISILRNTLGNNNLETIFISGYYVKDDGGGGLFYWDSTSQEADNNGTIIKPNNKTLGRWKRAFSGATNVKWFGAKGDGVSDDRDSIQKALDFSSNVFIPSGDYFISNRIFPKSNQTFLGAGIGVTRIITATNISYGSIYIKGVNYLNIGDFTLNHFINNTKANGLLIVDTEYPNNTNTGIYPKNINVNNVEIIGYDDHEYLIFSFADNIKITNCIINGKVNTPSLTGQELIEFGNGNDILIQGCTLKNGSNAGINFFSNNNRHKIRVVNNSLENCYVGINGILKSTQTNDMIISNNTIYNIVSYGININSNSGSINNCIISNNIIKNTESNNGISINAGGANLLVKDNFIENIGINGIQLRNFKNLSVQGNNLRNINKYGIYILGTSIGNSEDIQISSNLISDTKKEAIVSYLNRNVFIRENTVLRWNLINTDFIALKCSLDEYINVENNVFLKSDSVTETQCISLKPNSSYGLMKGNRANYIPSISNTFENLSTNSIKSENTYGAELIANPNMLNAQSSDWFLSNSYQIEITTNDVLKYTDTTGGNFAKATIPSYSYDKFKIYIYVQEITTGNLTVRVSGTDGSIMTIYQPGFHEFILKTTTGNFLIIEAPSNELVNAVVSFCSIKKMISNNLN